MKSEEKNIKECQKQTLLISDVINRLKSIRRFDLAHYKNGEFGIDVEREYNSNGDYIDYYEINDIVRDLENCLNNGQIPDKEEQGLDKTLKQLCMSDIIDNELMETFYIDYDGYCRILHEGGFYVEWLDKDEFMGSIKTYDDLLKIHMRCGYMENVSEAEDYYLWIIKENELNKLQDGENN